MKLSRPLWHLMLTMSVVLAPHCTMAAGMPGNMEGEGSSTMEMATAHIDSAMPPCCALHASQSRAAERVATPQKIVSIPPFVAPRSALAMTGWPPVPSINTRCGPPRTEKFETRSSCKRE